MTELIGSVGGGGGLSGKLAAGGTLTGQAGGPSGGGLAYQIGSGLKVEEGVLMVDTAERVEEDNTRPVTSAAVYLELGNVQALLANL